MTSIRIAVAALLAVAAVFAGGGGIQHAAPARASLAAVYSKAGPVPCCEE